MMLSLARWSGLLGGAAAVPALMLFALTLSGCPVYSSDQLGCYYATDCPAGYQCSFDGYCVAAFPFEEIDGGTLDGAILGGGTLDSGSHPCRGRYRRCSTWPGRRGRGRRCSTDSSRAVGDSGATALVIYCGAPSDCAPTETCAADGMCHGGDCTVNSCINQFQCSATPQGFACVHGASGACSVDTQCRTTERCIDGACSPLADLCVDRTQCASGELCVAGRCITSCSSDPECAAGFACRLALGVCDAPLRACAITSDCADPNSVCVAGGCVPRCHALGACGQGNGVCVDNGCVPSVKAERQCDSDTSCGEGRVCVRHHCYVSCESPSDAACANLPASPICKAITVGGASRRICGTTQNLGSECDPAEGKSCPAGGICIDGFCR